ncbi:MAG: hypothetical protein ACK4V6_09100 [Microthrixaceae bacterium]
MDFVGWGDRSVLEAASWRLGSEVVRRHPTRTRLFHGHPGGGQYDVLWVRSPSGSEGVDVPMNRNGTIQVHARFDGESVEDQLFISCSSAGMSTSAPIREPSSTVWSALRAFRRSARFRLPLR